MTYENLNRLDALLASLPPIDFISHNPAQAEPLTYHRRGQRFKSSTAHHAVQYVEPNPHLQLHYRKVSGKSRSSPPHFL